MFGRAESSPLPSREKLASGRLPCRIGVSGVPQVSLSRGPWRSQSQSPLAELERWPSRDVGPARPHVELRFSWALVAICRAA